MLNFDEPRFLRIQSGAVALAERIDSTIASAIKAGAESLYFLGTGGVAYLMQPAYQLLQRNSKFSAFIDYPAELILTGSANLTAKSIVVCDLDGQLLEGELSPSSDTAAHAYVYRHRPDVGGVVHTHSTYACAWAAVGESIPCALTAMADEFGGEIPLGPFARIGDDSIGRGIVETLDGHRSTAVIMKNHGVFSIGRDAKSAVKSAVMCEDVARTVHISRQLGEPLPIDPQHVDALFDRYQNVYGQR
jgi:L-ribulose-5-phosphate 4-epimerase